MCNLGDVFDNALTREEWWAEYNANRCCPSWHYAARTGCGCGGSDVERSGISRLL